MYPKATPPPFYPPNDTNSHRISKVEEAVDKLETSERKLSETVMLTGIKIENAIGELSNRIKVFEEQRSFWAKVLVSVVAACAIGIIAWAFRISWFVQTNKLVGGG